MDYLIAVQAPCYRVRAGFFATESAFGEHLLLLRRKLTPHFERLHIAAPQLSDQDYEENKTHLIEIDEAATGVEYVAMHPETTGFFGFWFRHAFGCWRRLWRATRRCAVVHTGVADDIWRPMLLLSMLCAVLQRKKSLYFVDIDFRRDAWMNYVTGRWSLKSYLLCRFVYDLLRRVQIWLAVRRCSLVLLKGRSMVEDYGRGRDSVRYFYNTVHAPEHIISAERLAQKLARLRDPAHALRLVYFGRLVAYKGIDRMLRAFADAVARSPRPLELKILGGGPEKPRLEALATELGLGGRVEFIPPIKYGTALFDVLYECDVALATPLSEDTPRAAFDALAAGVPIAAFGTQYYRDLATSDAVEVSEWPKPDKFADLILELDADRERLERMVHKGVTFARENTQDLWLDRRVAWTLALFNPRERAAPAGAGTEYLVVVQAPVYPISPDEFAVQSAFGQHLLMFREKLGTRFSCLCLAAPRTTHADYLDNRGHYMTLSNERDGLRCVALHPVNMRFVRFWLLEWIRVWRKLWVASRRALVVHAGIADDVWRPALLFANLSGFLQRKKTIFIVDIDFREDAWRRYKTGMWSYKSYWLCRYVYDQLRVWQLRFAVRTCSLVLLKGNDLVKDFGRGQSNVKNFYDTAHTGRHIVTTETLALKRAQRAQPNYVLKAVYFGRLVEYKGLDRSIRAIHRVNTVLGRPFELLIIGNGDQKRKLQELVQELGATAYIHFLPPQQYGEDLFKSVANADLSLATPLSEDTPRCAFDAMAAGVPIIAFDLAYYRSLESSGAVITVEWPSVEKLADRLAQLDRHREEIDRMAVSGTQYAWKNTQEIWLERRLEWTFDLLKEPAVLPADPR
ncbi:MAG: glycosyltransferase [Planctomycetota bacterium]